MYPAPYFAAGYYPPPYFPEALNLGNGEWFPATYFGSSPRPGEFWIIGNVPVPPTNGEWFPATYFGASPRPGEFWPIGRGAPPPNTRDGGGGGWDVVKTNAALRREAARIARLEREDDELLEIIKVFLQGNP